MVIKELLENCSGNKKHTPNKYVNLHKTIKTQREKICLKRNGRQFSSIAHINGSIDLQSYCDTNRAYNNFVQQGYGYFISGKVYYDEIHQSWSVDKPSQGNIYVNINIIDKIKVRSMFLSTANISRQYHMTGTNGVNNRHGNKNHDMFLQEVSNCKDPMATWARYRTVESGLALAVGPNDVTVNTINVNMPRGVHEHMLLLRTIACHHKSNNCFARIIPLIEYFKLNNNSVTVDSVFSAIQNEISFINRSINNKADFNVLPKAEFRTHKLLTAWDRENFFTYHKDTDTRRSIPIKGIEMQVHQRSLNCSAISGPQLLHLIKQTIVDLLNYANSGDIQIDICLANAKALCEKLSHSLIIPCINDFCEILCRKLNTYQMSMKEQMQTYETIIVPILQKIFMSRDNYATCGTFASVTPVGNRLLAANDRTIVSHKYRYKETMDLFATFREDELPSNLKAFIQKANQYTVSIPNRRKSRNSSNAAKYLRQKKKRTAGIVYNTALCQKRYITALQRYNILLPSPNEV